MTNFSKPTLKYGHHATRKGVTKSAWEVQCRDEAGQRLDLPEGALESGRSLFKKDPAAWAKSVLSLNGYPEPLSVTAKIQSGRTKLIKLTFSSEQEAYKDTSLRKKAAEVLVQFLRCIDP